MSLQAWGKRVWLVWPSFYIWPSWSKTRACSKAWGDLRRVEILTSQALLHLRCRHIFSPFPFVRLFFKFFGDSITGSFSSVVSQSGSLSLAQLYSSLVCYPAQDFLCWGLSILLGELFWKYLKNPPQFWLFLQYPLICQHWFLAAWTNNESICFVLPPKQLASLFLLFFRFPEWD